MIVSQVVVCMCSRHVRMAESLDLDWILNFSIKLKLQSRYKIKSMKIALLTTICRWSFVLLLLLLTPLWMKSFECNNIPTFQFHCNTISLTGVISLLIRTLKWQLLCSNAMLFFGGFKMDHPFQWNTIALQNGRPFNLRF